MATQVLSFVVCMNPPAGGAPCPAEFQQVASGVLIDSGQLANVTAIINSGGIDWEVVQTVAGYSLLFFGIGAGIGLILNVLRRMKP